MQFGTLIKSLAAKAGIKGEDETLKKILAFGEASQFEVPEEFAQALERNLLTSESALVNDQIRKKIFAEALNGVDAELDTYVDDFGFDDADKAAYKGIEKDTNKKIRTIKATIKKLMDKKGEGTKKEDAALQKEIDRLNAEAVNLKTSYEEKLSALQSSHLEDKKQWTLRSALSGKKLPQNGLDASINILTAETLIKQQMAKEGIFVSFDEAGNPVLKTKRDGSDLDYFVDNKKVDYNEFLDGVLAQNKFLQVNDPGNPPNPGERKIETPLANQSNQSVVSAVDAQLAELGMKI